VADTLRRFGRESMLSCKPAIEGKPLSTRTLATHMLSRLEHECRNADTKPVEPRQSDSSDTWTRAADAAAGAFA
jgi:hypothetical protein